MKRDFSIHFLAVIHIFAASLLAEPLYEPVDMHSFLNISQEEVAGQMAVEQIPFKVWQDGKKRFSLSEAGWEGWQKDSGSYNEPYDGGEAEGQGMLPLLNIPKGDYIAAYLLGVVEGNEGEVSDTVTLRIGARNPGSGAKSQVLMRDFSTRFPKDAKGRLVVARVPINEAFSQDIEGGIMALELTKEIRLARRSPDPCRFRWRPLGLPSGVKLAGITLERSPIQLRIEGEGEGNLFSRSSSPSFKVQLKNITGEPQSFRITLRVEEQSAFQVGTLLPEEEKGLKLELPKFAPGWYPVEFTLEKEDKVLLLRRKTAMAVLEEGDRPYRSESPFGVSSGLSGIHFTPMDSGLNARLLKKLGLHYVNAKGDDVPYAVRKENGLRQGHEFTVKLHHKKDQLEAYRQRRESDPDLLPALLMFHEEAISGLHATRVPDLFTDRAHYQLSKEEQATFSKMLQVAEQTGKLFKANHPEVSINLGNGTPTLREEFYRAGFSKEWFDTAGNESPAFGRPPETQPPDAIGNNSSLWMDRQMLDHYGYSEKKITQSWEVSYPGTNPGNLSLETHAAYVVRHKLHSLAWGVPEAKGGALYDFGNSYQYSNWGQTGLFTARPSIAPKPAAVTVAAMTLALDGTRYAGFYDTGSESVYLMRFQHKDGGSVWPFWVVRGSRDVIITLSKEKSSEWITPDGAREQLGSNGREVTLSACATPGYLILPEGVEIEAVQLGAPHFPASEPGGKLTPLAELSSPTDWKLEAQRNPILEYYNPMTPRRKGNFKLARLEEAGQSVLQVTPEPLQAGNTTMPMYVELVAEKEMILPGKPVEIGLWVNGNSSWGRIIFELEDQSGQRWTSIGARSKRGGSAWVADWLGKEEAASFDAGEQADWNTDDAWGLSRINFDGWKYLSFPLPGHYPGEGYGWPANSQWRADKDGTVHYPLRLKKVILELPEKTLHLTRYAAPKRPWIQLGKVISVEREAYPVKSSPYEYQEAMQIDYR